MRASLCVYAVLMASGDAFCGRLAPRSSLRGQRRPILSASVPERLSSTFEDVSNRATKLDVGALGSAVAENLQDGTTGERGEIFVAAQFGALLFWLIGGIPFIGGPIFALGSLALVLSGISLILAGIITLDTDLTPFPAPIASNELKVSGVYSLSRHPIYGGLLLVCFGFSFLTDSAIRAALSLILLFILTKKVEAEEKFLVEKHGKSYQDYQENVPSSLIPFLDAL